MKVFLVTSEGRRRTSDPKSNRHVLINIPAGLENEREYVKREAQRFLLGHPDDYTVEPLTDHGDVVFLNLAIGNTRRQ